MSLDTLASKAIIKGVSEPQFVSLAWNEFIETTLSCCKYNFTPIGQSKVFTCYEGENSEVCSFEIMSPGEILVRESNSYPMLSRNTLYHCIDYRIELTEPGTIVKSRFYRGVEIAREAFVFGVKASCANCLKRLLNNGCRGQIIH